MKLRNVFDALPLAGLIVAGCNPATTEIGSSLIVKCTADPQGIITEQYDVLSNQVFRLGNNWVKVIAPGRVSFDVGRDDSYTRLQIQGPYAYVRGRDGYEGRIYKVSEEALPDQKTRLTIVHNCADPLNP